MSKEDRAYLLAFLVLASVLALWFAGTITVGGVNLADRNAYEAIEREGFVQLREPHLEPMVGHQAVTQGDADENPEGRDASSVSESLLLDGASEFHRGPSSEDPLSLSFTAAKELFWVPSEEILLHVYRESSAEAGLYDEERDLVRVDPQIVHEAWIRDGGLRASLARVCELVELGWGAWSAGREDVVEALERDRVAAVGEIWRYYSPAAYSAYLRATR